MSVIHDDTNDILRVVSNGEKSFRTARDLWQKVSAVAQETTCFKVLGTAFTTQNHRIMEGYDHHELFRQLGIDRRYKITWVELNEAMYEDVAFIATVLVNRGTRITLFSDPDEAHSWLLGSLD